MLKVEKLFLSDKKSAFVWLGPPYFEYPDYLLTDTEVDSFIELSIIKMMARKGHTNHLKEFIKDGLKYELINE